LFNGSFNVEDESIFTAKRILRLKEYTIIFNNFHAAIGLVTLITGGVLNRLRKKR